MESKIRNTGHNTTRPKPKMPPTALPSPPCSNMPRILYEEGIRCALVTWWNPCQILSRLSTVFLTSPPPRSSLLVLVCCGRTDPFTVRELQWRERQICRRSFIATIANRGICTVCGTTEVIGRSSLVIHITGLNKPWGRMVQRRVENLWPRCRTTYFLSERTFLKRRGVFMTSASSPTFTMWNSRFGSGARGRKCVRRKRRNFCTSGKW
mmetsp:Transcript_10023/g.28187  ORF Transcript_10023/g.28187 Transcript_10023/m.28187 type:complete len:209 (+) Transcript_10023:486-1112(+)